MVDRRVGSLSIVQADVKRFIQEFGIGATIRPVLKELVAGFA